MRVPENLQKIVVFVGFAGPEESGGIECVGTAFFANCESEQYLVTVKHVAQAIGDNPFMMRFNKTDGESENVHVDALLGHGPQIQWYGHPTDLDVDLVAAPFHYDLLARGYDSLALNHLSFADEDRLLKEGVGVGDATYTIGLFRFVAGKRRNLPVIHTGAIALFPGDERLPVDDWDRPDNGFRRTTEAFLVQSQSLRGLSGSPVFVRPTFAFPETGQARLPKDSLLLLGIWQGAWDSKADEILAFDRGREIRVPVGFGIVVPASKLLDIFNRPDLKAQRAERKAVRERNAVAQLDTQSGTVPNG